MFRKIAPIVPIFLVSILVLVCLIAAQYIPSHNRSAHQAQPQNAPTALLEVAMTNSGPAKVQDATRLQVEASYGNLPLSFEPNRGQIDPRVKFLSRSGNRTLWLTSDEAVLSVGRPPRSIAPQARQAAVSKDQISPAVLRMKFVGANTSPTIEGEARQPGTINYFAGKPDEWRTKIPTYARVRYRSVYPGIDLVFYGNNRELEYDLVVSPGADPGQIKLALAGADEIRIDVEGNLVLKTSQGEVIQQKPRIYQRSGATLKAVSGDYVITGKDEVGFRLGSYDRRAAVVIDPVLRYSSFLGGSGLDVGTAIAVDSSNRAVVTGQTCSPNFPTTIGNTSPNPCSAFITKLDFTGSRLIFSTLIGTASSGEGVALDPAGNVYVAGETAENFPTTPGAFQTVPRGAGDAFVTKLNPTGTALVYSTFLGGTDGDGAAGIAVDSSGNAYVTGSTNSKNFPTTPGVFQPSCKLAFAGSCLNVFITKLNFNGSRALYSTFLGGSTSSIQSSSGIAVDTAGNAFVTGETDAADFPTTAGSAQPIEGGSEDAFVVKLSSSGSHLIYSTFLGGISLESGHGIALDSVGNAFVTGITTSANFPVKNAFQPHCAAFCAFVSKLDSNGRLVYSTFLGGGSENGTGIAVTPAGQAYATGHTESPLFPTTQTAFQRVFRGAADIFLTKLDPAGKLVHSTYAGENGALFPVAVALDRDTNAYLTGAADFDNSGDLANFPITPGAFQQKPGGGGDAFVAKVVSLCALSTVNRTVTICVPANGSTVKSPVNIIAGTTDVTPARITQIYLDGKKIFEARLSAINVSLPMAGGTHRLTVQALDTASVFFKKTISVTVSPH